MPELPWQFVERKMKRFRRSGHASLNLRYTTGKHTGDYFLGEDLKDSCLSGNKECTGKGSIKLIVSVLGKLGWTLGDNITELSINVSLALMGIIIPESQRTGDSK